MNPPIVMTINHRRTSAFTLVTTLIILAVLAVAVVGFLASMIGERETADAYTSKTRAEDAAQTGVYSAMAEMQEAFRDYPDSCTVWDQQQSTNVNYTSSAAPANSTQYNEGTSLYLRAVPQSTPPNGTIVPNPNPSPSPSPAQPASDVNGNGPNNSNRNTFVLPLVSGVPNGYARLVSQKANVLPTDDLSQTNPALQTYTDLNVRRFAGDLQGAIGSPPGWGATVPPPIPTPSPAPAATPVPTAPKPVRAPWVTITDNNGLVSGRYAFWIEDESFRLNANYAGDVTHNAQGEPNHTTTTRIDNGPDANTNKFPANTITGQPYALQPTDATLAGGLLAFDPNSGYNASVGDAQDIVATRSIFPNAFFPDPLAFTHSAASTSGAATMPNGPLPTSLPMLDWLRYEMSAQSGTLNLTRHGTERLNLNTTIATVDPTSDSPPYTASIQKIQHQVDQLVATLQFHLPNFGQRFYRLSTAVTGATLNALQVAPIASVGDPGTIYQYKVAANLRDFIDTDYQPTMILATGGGTVAPMAAPTGPATDEGVNVIWAQGKESAPLLQETVVRYRPTINTTTHTYTLAVDYYLEFWNMSDHDIYASTDLHNAFVTVTNQQSWTNQSGTLLNSQSGMPPRPRAPESDYKIDLTNGVFFGGQPAAKGVVFAAGTATVITTDPDYQTYVVTPSPPPGGLYGSRTGVSNPLTTFYCPNLISANGAGRTFSGPLPTVTDTAIEPVFREAQSGGTQDYETEVTLGNPYGYIDSVLYAVAEGGSPVPTKSSGPNDYAYGGSLHGNSLPSCSGDPRSNNEQLIIKGYNTDGDGDQSRYYNGWHSLGYPDSNDGYVLPDANAYPWPDYYKFPGTPGSNGQLSTNPDKTNAPAVMADSSLSSIGQLGDVYDPARIASTTTTQTAARGGGRSYKIGQRDDRVTYDPTGNPSSTTGSNNQLDIIPTSLGWASWRLTDVFSAGPAVTTAPYGATQEPLELPARLNINGVLRDNGAAFRALLTGFKFQPVTATDPLFHTPQAFAGAALDTTDNNAGFVKLLTQMTTRLNPANFPLLAGNVPWGPFFERGELSELDVNNTSIFGKNVTSTFQTSTGLIGVDMNRTFDHGREELFRRLAELICTRGDTFTVYAVGQSLLPLPGVTPTPANATPGPAPTFKITGTQRMRVTFRLVPKQVFNGVTSDFHPAYTTNPDGTIAQGLDFDPHNSDPTKPTSLPFRFSKPDHYDVQILAANAF